MPPEPDADQGRYDHQRRGDPRQHSERRWWQYSASGQPSAKHRHADTLVERRGELAEPGWLGRDEMIFDGVEPAQHAGAVESTQQAERRHRPNRGCGLQARSGETFDAQVPVDQRDQRLLRGLNGHRLSARRADQDQLILWIASGLYTRHQAWLRLLK